MDESNSLSEVISGLAEKQWQDMLFEFNRITDFVNEQFPEVQFRVEFNDNVIDSKLRIKMRIFTDKTMDPDDQLLRFINLKPMSVEMFQDPIFMDKFLKELYPSVTKSIANAVNTWYAKKKEEQLRKRFN